MKRTVTVLFDYIERLRQKNPSKTDEVIEENKDCD